MKRIRLTESELHNMIKESINKLLREARKPSDRTVGRHTLKGLRYDRNGNPLYTCDTMSDEQKKSNGWRFSKIHGYYGQLGDPTKLHENDSTQDENDYLMGFKNAEDLPGSSVVRQDHEINNLIKKLTADLSVQLQDGIRDIINIACGKN